ncbi:MAG: putative O-glycosylation ligase, exosortase A system-associated [Magnetococcales bacterium]|nr:putative O-glycosylation ligase, exosortase A system-associated [Magnetococcales bacterium]
MRDLFLTLFVFGMLPVAVFQPYVGVYLWAWISYMNPHRLTWSFAYDFRFNFFVAVTTIAGIILFWKKTSKIPRCFTTYLLFGFLFWTTVSSYFSINYPWTHWQQLVKIYAMIVATFLVIDSRKKITVLVAIITLSVGFFGVKGGIFTITTGGNFQVVGPARSFFSDNNMFALAELMVVPMFLFLRSESKSFWLRLSFLVMSMLSALSIVGSYSRGGLVGLVVIVSYFWLRSKAKIRIAAIIFFLVPIVFNLMAERWQERMISMTEKFEIPQELTELFTPKELFDVSNSPFPDVYKTEEEESEPSFTSDSSFRGRLDAWELAWLVALDRPFYGGGFNTFHYNVFRRYLPNVQRRAAHSLYFQVLGEHGFVGFGFWMLMHIAAYRVRNSIIRMTRKVPDLLWASELARYIGISMIGYYVGGVFLGLAYFDLPLHYISILIILRVIVKRELAKIKVPPKEPTMFPYVPGQAKGLPIS